MALRSGLLKGTSPVTQPLKVGVTLLELGMKPYFDELHYNSGLPLEEYNDSPALAWKPVHLSKLIDTYIDGEYQNTSFPEEIETRLQECTGLPFADIFNWLYEYTSGIFSLGVVGSNHEMTQ